MEECADVTFEYNFSPFFTSMVNSLSNSELKSGHRDYLTELSFFEKEIFWEGGRKCLTLNVQKIRTILKNL